MEDIVLVGNGGFAREVRWLIEECNGEDKKWNILGWITNDNVGETIDGLPVLGDDNWLISYDKPINVVLSVGSGKLRKILAEKYNANSNIKYPNIVAPSARMSKKVEFGKGCIITEQSVFTVNIKVGDFFICNLASTVGHDCVIGNYVTLFPGAHVSGCVNLENGVSVGTGASIIQGLVVGENTFIGAGAAVIKNLPKDCTAVGVPAKPLEKKNE